MNTFLYFCLLDDSEKKIKTRHKCGDLQGETKISSVLIPFAPKKIMQINKSKPFMAMPTLS